MEEVRYKELYNSEIYTIYPDTVIEASACCDCGLVHDIIYKIKNKETLEIMNTRNNRATGQMRRWMRARKEGVFNSGNTR
ncbi:hypothetical protein KAR91_73855 [Candidatus Pacearchaeota archaeon]|nr:hypothetical protein [Candidatus Pacearchaeota archaeon]